MSGGEVWTGAVLPIFTGDFVLGDFLGDDDFLGEVLGSAEETPEGPAVEVSKL